MGCRVDDADVHRWESTERGPEKLVAVLEHDKYAIPLRVEAAMSLVRMRPRNGRRIGTELMTDAMSELPADARQKIIDGVPPENDGIAPQLIKQIQAPPPVRKPDGTLPGRPVDPVQGRGVRSLDQHDPPLVTNDQTKACRSARR